MNPFLAYGIGAFTATVFSFIVLGRVIHRYYALWESATRQVRRQHERIIDLEARKSPTYQIPTGGVDPVARRNVAPPPIRQPVDRTDYETVIHISDHDELSVTDHRYMHRRTE